MAEILKRELALYKAEMITGDVKVVDRNDIINRFTAGQFPILIMTSAGQFGLNLQAANIVIHYDQPFSIAGSVQRNGRAHRMGQERMVLIYHLLASETVDEKVYKKLKIKQSISDKILSVRDIEELI